MSAPLDDLVLVGIGGGGSRFVAETVARGIPGIRAIAFDSDASSPPDGVEFHPLGVARLEGRGTGGDTVKGRAAAQDDADLVRNAVGPARLAVVAVSLGGGFGSGAAPDILKAMRDRGVTTLCLATSPFALEGADRDSLARRQLPLVQTAADATAVITMDSLFAGAADEPLPAAFGRAASAMADVLSLFWVLLARPGFISVGVERMLAIIAASGGRLRVGVASAEGEDRAVRAVDSLFASPMLGTESRIDGAGTVQLGVIAGNDLRLSELSAISDSFRRHLPAGCTLSFGTVLDDALAGSVKLVGLFFDSVIKEETEEPRDRIVSAGHPARRPARKDPLARDAQGGRFRGSEGTIYEGQDLDVPTFQRRNLPIDK